MRGALLGGGGSAEVFAWGEDRVVKLFRPAYAHIAPLELERARAVAASGAPCPAVYEAIELDGRRGIVFERVDGPLLILRVREAPAAVGGELADLHARILRLPGTRLPGVLALAESALERIPEADRPAQRERIARLPSGDQLGHGDFHPGNVIVSEAGPRVVDWPNAARCAPGVDVARSFVLMRFGIGEDRYARDLEARVAMRRTLTESYLARIFALEAAAREDVEATLPVVADAILRQVAEHPHRDALRRLAAAEEGLP